MFGRFIYVYPYELILLYLAFPSLTPLMYTPIPPTPPSRVTLPSARPAFTMFPTHSPTSNQAFPLLDGLLLTLLQPPDRFGSIWLGFITRHPDSRPNPRQYIRMSSIYRSVYISI